MAANNVEFYTRMQRLQKQQHESEQQRMELEHKFTAYLSSDKRLSRLKAAKLQRVWQKVCEDEKRSKARNQQLLSDYHRVEAHVSALSTRTERLRLLKDQYERQVELMYPKWKEQLESKRLHQQFEQQRKQQQQAGALQGRPVFNGAPYSPQHPQAYSSIPNGTNSLGPSPQFPQTNAQLQNSQTPYGSQYAQAYPSMPNGAGPNLGPSPQFPQPNMHLPMGQTPYGQRQVVPNNEQTGVYEGQRLHEGQRVSVDDTSQKPSSLYDTLTRPNTQVATPVFDELRGNYNYTQLMQDPKARLEPGSLKPTMVQNEDYSHLMQMPQHRNNDTGNQMTAQGLHHQQQQQQQPQQVRQELPQQNIRPGQYRPKADSVGETSSTISVSSDSHYSVSDIRPQITVTSTQQGTRGINKSANAHVPRTVGNEAEIAEHQNKNQHGNKEEAVDNDNDYLLPITTNGVKDSKQSSATSRQRIGSEGQQGTGKILPVSSRTEPFSSEGEEDEDEDDEDDEDEDEEEEDEDSAALRDALQDQLTNGVNPVVKVEVTKHGSPDQEELPQQAESNIRKSPEQMENVRLQQDKEEEEKNDTTDEEGENDESVSEIGSDMSLPLSDTQDGQAKPGGSTWTAGQETMGTTSSRNSGNVALPSLTVKGFWLLTHAVEIEIEQSDNISGIYNSANCTDAIRNEIVKSANKNSSLSHLDPNAISMVIIQMLPSIVETLPGGCMMSDKLLSSKRPVNEVTIRSFIYSAALGFWDQLLRHLELLMRKGVLEPDEVAAKFAPQLISPGSNMADKAVDVLCKVLEDLQANDSFNDESSSATLPTPTPTPQKQNDTGEEGNQQHLKVPRLNLGGDTDRSDRSEDLESDNDSFFDSKVPLTETDAYQRLIGNTVTMDTAKSDAKEDAGGDDEESESEDEIEKAARITPQSPAGSAKKKRNVLSSLGGSLGLSYSSDEDDDDNKLKVTGGGSTQRSEQVSSPSQSDLASSPSPPGTGYIPSAMEHSIKSTARSDTLQRSAAFWGEESDMDESEMSVPMGTGTTMKSEEKDDFDFYD